MRYHITYHITRHFTILEPRVQDRKKLFDIKDRAHVCPKFNLNLKILHGPDIFKNEAEFKN